MQGMPPMGSTTPLTKKGAAAAQPKASTVAAKKLVKEESRQSVEQPEIKTERRKSTEPQRKVSRVASQGRAEKAPVSK